jgi:hypothetical protein
MVAMAASLSGVRPALVEGVADHAEELREAASILRACPSAAAQHVADALERWLKFGGDLEKRLGVRPRPGYPSAPVTLRCQTRNARIREFALSLRVEGRTAQARAMVAALQAREPQVLALHEELGLPSSVRQFIRVLGLDDKPASERPW